MLRLIFLLLLSSLFMFYALFSFVPTIYMVHEEKPVKVEVSNDDFSLYRCLIDIDSTPDSTYKRQYFMFKYEGEVILVEFIENSKYYYLNGIEYDVPKSKEKFLQNLKSAKTSL